MAATSRQEQGDVGQEQDKVGREICEVGQEMGSYLKKHFISFPVFHISRSFYSNKMSFSPEDLFKAQDYSPTQSNSPPNIQLLCQVSQDLL